MLDQGESSCRSILIIEDDFDIRNLLAEALELEGYQAFCAENGKAGIGLLEELRHPCLILFDLMMPVMDGREFLNQLRKEHNDIVATLPVVIASAATNDAAKFAEEFKVPLIKKPLDLDQLLRTVRKYCGDP